MAGSATAVVSDIGMGMTKFVWSWTSDGSGNVSVALPVKAGRLRQTRYNPSGGPTNAYNMTILDADSFDILGGDGASLSGTVIKVTTPTTPQYVEAQNMTLTISGAGVTKSGIVTLYMGP